MGGHSFGGLTALTVAEKDKRIKAVITLDPWIWSRNHDVITNNFKLSQPSFNIITEGFGPVIQKVFSYDVHEIMEYLLSQADTDKHELIYFKETNHYHQTDAICIMPVEFMVKSSNRPHHNVAELYLLNTQAAMVFLNKNGLNNSFDADKLEAHVNKLGKKFLDYKMKYDGKSCSEASHNHHRFEAFEDNEKVPH